MHRKVYFLYSNGFLIYIAETLLNQKQMNAINEQVRTTTKNRQIIGIGKKQKKLKEGKSEAKSEKLEQ